MAGMMVIAWHNSWGRIALGFFVTLGLTAGAVAMFHAPHENLGIALKTSARMAFLFFWPAYAGGALTSLFGDSFSPLKRHARDLGLAFAGALLVHLSLVAYLCASGSAPPAQTFVVFGPAAVLTYLLVLFSIDRVRQAIPASFWRVIRVVAMNYIMLAFIDDFKNFRLTDLRDLFLYFPFAAFAIIGLLLRLATWIQNLIQAWTAPRRLGAHS
jgi:hypothetical protein